MKRLQLKMFFLALIGLFLLSSCNQNEEILSDEIVAQMDILGAPATECCAECGTSCVLGFEFSSDITDANHVQGGYLVKKITGDCSCEYVNNEWIVSTTGPVTYEAAITGGPGAGGACYIGLNQLMMTLFNDPCGANWSNVPTGGDPNPFGDWGQWTTDILDRLQNSNFPSGSFPYGVVGFPAAWQIGIVETKADLMEITLGIPAQVTQLQKIALFPSGSSSAVLSKIADGSKTYKVDMKGLPDGTYDLKMAFAPGFYIVETLHKTTPR